MRIKIALTAGFCMGVKRAITLALDTARGTRVEIFTYGPLIHNRHAISLLESKGVKVLPEGAGLEGKTVVIRSHGASPRVFEELKKQGALICDATCPKVRRVQSIIQKHASEGYTTVIVGDRGHAEVIGLLGYAGKRGRVVENLEDVDRLPPNPRVCVVSQTTQNKEAFKTLLSRIRGKYPECVSFETICDSTSQRQEEVLQMVSEVDLMIVVGGQHSANTCRLAEISRSKGVPTLHVESAEEISPEHIEGAGVIGVTAGASTPHWIITQVIDWLEALDVLRKSALARLFFSIFDLLAKSNLYTALGAAAVTYAVSLLQGLPPKLTLMAISSLTVYSMYVLLFYFDRENLKISFPEVAGFYQKFQFPFFLTGLGAIVAAHILAAFLGVLPFLTVLAAGIMALLYGIPINGQGLGKFLPHRKIKALPLSKDLFYALGWATITVLTPRIASRPFFTWELLRGSGRAFFFVSGMTFIISVINSVHIMEADRLMGKETLPILVGKDKTKAILLTLALLLILILSVPVFHLPNRYSLSLLLVPTIFYTCFYLYMYHRRIIYQRLSFHLVVKSTLFLIGLMGLLWELLRKEGIL